MTAQPRKKLVVPRVAERGRSRRIPAGAIRELDTPARILGAASRVFAAHGFEGARMQEIADEASVKLPLIVYHFKSKRNLWEAVVNRCAARVLERTACVSKMDGTATERLHRLIEIWAEIVAENPDYHRLMTLEGHRYSDRLQWLCDVFLRRQSALFCELVSAAQKEGGVREVDPQILRYVVIGAASLPSVAAEYRLLSGRDPMHPKEIRKTIKAIEQLIFVSPSPASAPRRARSR